MSASFSALVVQPWLERQPWAPRDRGGDIPTRLKRIYQTKPHDGPRPGPRGRISGRRWMFRLALAPDRAACCYGPGAVYRLFELSGG